MTAVEVMTNYMAAMSSGDFESGFGYFAVDVVGDVPGRSSLAGQRRGRAAVEGYIRDVIAHTRGNVSVELLDMLVGDVHVELMVPEKLGDDEHRVVRLIESSGFGKPRFGPRAPRVDHRRR